MTTRQATETRTSLAWLRPFLKEELAPYPGRDALVARMLLASTIVMILSMTFRMPFGAYGSIYALVISREDRQSTVQAVKTIVVAFALAGAGVLVGARLFAGDPMLRLLWVIGTLFLMFYALSAMSNYTAAARFGYLIIISGPLWDKHIPAESKVKDTLWAVGTIGLASVITAAIEVAFASVRPWDDLLRSLGERLTAVEQALRSYAVNGRVEEDTANKITRMGLLGASRLRRVLHRSGHALHYGEQMGAVIALVGRLVDLTATLAALDVQIADADRSRIEKLADNVAKIRDDLLGQRIPELAASFDHGGEAPSIPLLREMERTVMMIPEVFTGSQSLDAYAPPPPGQAAPAAFFVPDAFTNPQHVKFALRGCLAASLCYIIYTALDWPEISTSITTCFLTALTTVGASRQKQVLRFAGAIAGGAIGMAAQVWILPYLDSIFGFTLLFLAVTAAAAWIITSGPRLSYFGVQLAVAFYLINLQEFKIQTSLTVARDRVAGILLGLSMMWLVFDQL
jgi:multidrug resistance protein MdtO